MTPPPDTPAFPTLVGTSAGMVALREQLGVLCEADAPTVLLTGESGTGKDVVAQCLHRGGVRSDRPFVEVDCASIPESLVESHLFGHERGAFTDAKQQKQGLLELARGGTVFLDEIGELPLGAQATLLRALENRRYKRVGGTSDLPLDAAVIAATHRDLRAMVAEGTFRNDLLYRLDVIRLRVPPLRERVDDLPELTAHFVASLNARLGRAFDGVDEVAMATMRAYDWPGNVRELRNVVERALILHPRATRIALTHLPEEIAQHASLPGTAPPIGPTVLAGRVPLAGLPGDGGVRLPDEGLSLEAVERSLILQALERTGGHVPRAAALLGITRFTLRYRIEKYGLAPSP